MEQLEADLRDHLIAAQMDKDPSLDDLRDMGLRFVANDALAGNEYASRLAADAQPQAGEGDGDESDEEDDGAAVAGGESAPVTNGSPDQKPLEIIQKRYKNLEHGDMPEVHAIVLHRTNTDSGNSVLNSYGAGQTTGAHFLIDLDGKVYQTADTSKKAWHVGPIHRRCEDDDSCSDEDNATINSIRRDREKSFGKKLKLVTKSELDTKDYPERLPANEDSIGIEVVGKYDDKLKKFDSPTPGQMESVRRLVVTLQKEHGLTDGDVYTHGEISYKKPSEGEDLGYSSRFNKWEN